MRLLPCLLFAAFCGCAPTPGERDAVDTGRPVTRYDPAPIPLFYERTDSATLHFQNDVRFETGLYDLEYFGQVQRHGGMPWLIMAGRHCHECDAELALYVHSPTDGPLISEGGANARYHPGRILDGETGQPWYEGRTFFGEVLSQTGGVIWYERVLHADGTVQEVTTLLDLDGERPVEMEFMDQDRLPQTLELMSRGLCQEIPGRDQVAAP
jgi:hypothetical protein